MDVDATNFHPGLVRDHPELKTVFVARSVRRRNGSCMALRNCLLTSATDLYSPAVASTRSSKKRSRSARTPSGT